MYGFVVWSFASVLTLSIAIISGIILVASGVLKRRRLSTWHSRQATAHRMKGALYPNIEWSHMGEIYSTVPHGVYLLRKREVIPILLHPTMPAVCEVDFWTNNGKGKIALGITMITLSAVFLIALLQ